MHQLAEITHLTCTFPMKHQDTLVQTTAFVAQQLGGKPTIADAARHVYLSESRLSHILRQELGYSFTEYVNLLRINHSKTLLLESRLSIAGVAKTIGFEDQGYFARVFKKITGVTPSAYRAQFI